MDLNGFSRALKRTAIVAAAFWTFSSSWSENLIFNSSFELGDGGFTLLRYLDREHLDYLKPELDSSAAGGRQAIKISNPFAQQIKLFINETKLEPGKEYTFSFSAKCSADSCPFNALFISATSGPWDVASKKFEAGREWKSFSFSFKTKAPWTQPYYSPSFQFCKELDAKGVDFWFDNLQLNAGPAQPWQPKAELEASIKLDSPIVVIGPDGGSLKAAASAVNNSGKRLKGELVLRAIDDRSGNSLKVEDAESFEAARISFDLAPGEAKAFVKDLPLAKCGFFRFEVSAKGVSSFASAPAYCAAIGPYDPKPLDLENVFYAGVNFAGCGMSQPPDWGDVVKAGVKSTGLSHSEYIDLYAKMGIRLFRDWDSAHPAFIWREIEKEQGSFDFGLADWTVDEAARRGIAVMPVLGASDFIFDEKRGLSWPSWVQPLCKDISKSGEWSKRVLLPPVDLWRKYVRAVAEHFKGRVKCYEIVNEANGFLSSEAYLDYLKPAYDEIKAVDRNAIVVGFCATGDKGGDLAGFLGECFKLGGAAYADAVSFHPYGSPNLASLVPADAAIEGTKKMLEKVGFESKPLWNTEVYYLLGYGIGEGNDRGNCQPQDVAQRFLTDLGEGVRQATPLCAPQLFKSVAAPHFENLYAWDYGHPSGNFVVYNSMARLFEGARPLGKKMLPNDCVCYVYERDGKRLAAIWRYGDFKGLKASLGFEVSEAKLYDIYGNRLPYDGKPVAVEAAPFYVETEMDGKAFLEKASEIKIEAAVPVAVGPLRLVPGGGWSALVALKNCSGGELSGKLGVQGQGVVGLEMVDFSIPANGEKSFKVPVNVKTSSPSKATVKVLANGKIWDFPTEIEAPAKVYPAGRKDGKPQDLSANGSAKFSASYDDAFLHLDVSVADSMPSGDPNGRKQWEQDCVELFIDADPLALPRKHADAYHDRIARLFVTPYAPNSSQLSVWPGKLEGLDERTVRAETAKSPGGYSVKLDIPLESLLLEKPLKGKCLGFEIAVDYADSSKRLKVESWNSHDTAYKDRLSFGFLEFE